MAPKTRGMALNLARRAAPPVNRRAGAAGGGRGVRPDPGMSARGPAHRGRARLRLSPRAADVRQADRRIVGFRLLLTGGLSLAILWQTGVI